MKDIFYGFFNLFRFYLIKTYRNKQKTLFNDRLAICKKCEHITSNNRCGICGCFIHAKTKVIYNIDNNNKSIDGCPEHKW